MRQMTAAAAEAALRAGDRVMVTHPDPFKASDKTSYTLVTAGRAIGKRTFEKLSERLEPMHDGLFEDGAPQSFALRAD